MAMIGNTSHSSQLIVVEDSPNQSLQLRLTNQQDITKTVAKILQDLMIESYNNQYSNPEQNPLLYPFWFQDVPRITIEDYLARIKRLSKCSEECFVMGLIYLDRIANEFTSLQFSKHNIYRLLFVAVLVSIKFVDDLFYSNLYYSKIAGLSLQELNGLEMLFVRLLKFDLNIAGQEFYRYHQVINHYSL